MHKNYNFEFNGVQALSPICASIASKVGDRYIIQLIQLVSLVFSQKGSAPRSIHFHPELLLTTEVSTQN